MSGLFALWLSLSTTLTPLGEAPDLSQPLRLDPAASLTMEIPAAVFPDPFEEIARSLEGIPLVVIDPFQGAGMVELRGKF